jgi:hypothetical protein
MEANDYIWPMAEWKSKKLKAGNRDCSDNTILVLQIMDCPLSELHQYIEDSMSAEGYGDLGFSEIWVADYSELDAYRAIEVFGLYQMSIGDIMRETAASRMGN